MASKKVKEDGVRDFFWWFLKVVWGKKSNLLSELQNRQTGGQRLGEDDDGLVMGTPLLQEEKSVSLSEIN